MKLDVPRIAAKDFTTLEEIYADIKRLRASDCARRLRLGIPLPKADFLDDVVEKKEEQMDTASPSEHKKRTPLHYPCIQDFLVQELGYEIKEECFQKGDHTIPFAALSKHSPATFAEKLRRECSEG